MATEESNIFKRCCVRLSEVFRSVIFRINTGRAWTGDRFEWSRDRSKLTIHNPRPFSTGTPPGYADGTGWTTVIVSPAMVGEPVAVFTAIETKTAKGRPTPAQLNFIEQVVRAGGIAGIARSADEAEQLVDDYFKRYSA